MDIWKVLRMITGIPFTGRYSPKYRKSRKARKHRMPRMPRMPRKTRRNQNGGGGWFWSNTPKTLLSSEVPKGEELTEEQEQTWPKTLLSSKVPEGEELTPQQEQNRTLRRELTAANIKWQNDEDIKILNGIIDKIKQLEKEVGSTQNEDKLEELNKQLTKTKSELDKIHLEELPHYDVIMANAAKLTSEKRKELIASAHRVLHLLYIYTQYISLGYSRDQVEEVREKLNKELNDIFSKYPEFKDIISKIMPDANQQGGGGGRHSQYSKITVLIGGIIAAPVFAIAVLTTFILVLIRLTVQGAIKRLTRR